MNTQEILLEHIRPFVRFAENVDIFPTKKPVKIQAYDHRIFYILAGDARVEIGNSIYHVSPGTLLYWMSGTPYSITPNKKSSLQIISINFDFLQNNSATVQYIPMVPSSDFQEKFCLERLSFTNALTLNTPLILPDMTSILSLLTDIVTETSSGEIQSQLQQSNLLAAVIVLIYRSSIQKNSIGKHGSSYKDILKYIQEHYSEDIDNHILAKLFNYHPNYISQLITSNIGTPLHQYLLKLRIRQAIILLQNTNIPISEIASMVGFKNSSYFSQYFKKSTGYSPSAFRIR